MQKYEIIKTLGEGGYGKALLVKRKSDNLLFVAKTIRLSNLSEEEKKEAMNEVTVLSALKHPYITQYIESFTENKNLYIIMEYADGGDLSLKIERQHGKLFTEDEILNLFTQIALAIKYIHDRKILHRDLKGQNVFLTKKGEVKLGDFGIAKVLDHTMQFCKTQIGTPFYLSPEICEGKNYNSKTDIWSLGCLLYEMCTLKHAFNGRNINNLLMNIVRGNFTPISSNYSPELRALVTSLLAKDPAKRPSANQIINNPLIKNRLTKYLSEYQLKKEMEHTVLHGHSPFEPEIQNIDYPPIEEEPIQVQNEIPENNFQKQNEEKQEKHPVQNQKNKKPSPPPVVLSPEEIAKRKQEEAKRILDREERMRQRYAEICAKRNGQAPPQSNQQNQQQQQNYQQNYRQQQNYQQNYRQQEQNYYQQQRNQQRQQQIEQERAQEQRQQMEKRRIEQQQQEEERKRREKMRIDEENRRIAEEQKRRKMEEEKRKEEEKMRRFEEEKRRKIEEERRQYAEQQRLLEIKQQKEEQERRKREFELKRQRQFEEENRIRREQEERKIQERIKHEKELAKMKADFAEKERIKREQQEAARKLAEEKWLQAAEEAKAEKRRKNEEKRRKAEEFDRQQQELADQREKERQQRRLAQQREAERIRKEQEEIERNKFQRQQQEKQRQAQREKQQQFASPPKQPAQKNFQRPQVAKQFQDTMDRRNPMPRNHSLDQNPVNRRKPVAKNQQIHQKPRVSFPETDMNKEQADPRLFAGFPQNGADSFVQNARNEAPSWAKKHIQEQADQLKQEIEQKRLNEIQQEAFSIKDVQQFQREHRDEINEMVRQQKLDQEDVLAASIKEALNNPHNDEDFVVGPPAKIYDGDKEVKLPVANDIESLMSRAEQLRSQIQDRLGKDKMLKLRREMMGIDEPKLINEVDPLSSFLMQNLLYLDEEIEQNGM